MGNKNQKKDSLVLLTLFHFLNPTIMWCAKYGLDFFKEINILT